MKETNAKEVVLTDLVTAEELAIFLAAINDELKPKFAILQLKPIFTCQQAKKLLFVADKLSDDKIITLAKDYIIETITLNEFRAIKGRLDEQAEIVQAFFNNFETELLDWCKRKPSKVASEIEQRLQIDAFRGSNWLRLKCEKEGNEYLENDREIKFQGYEIARIVILLEITGLKIEDLECFDANYFQLIPVFKALIGHQHIAKISSRWSSYSLVRPVIEKHQMGELSQLIRSSPTLHQVQLETVDFSVRANTEIAELLVLNWGKNAQKARNDFYALPKNKGFYEALKLLAQYCCFNLNENAPYYWQKLFLFTHHRKNVRAVEKVLQNFNGFERWHDVSLKNLRNLLIHLHSELLQANKQINLDGELVRIINKIESDNDIYVIDINNINFMILNDQSNTVRLRS